MGLPVALKPLCRPGPLKSRIFIGQTPHRIIYTKSRQARKARQTSPACHGPPCPPCCDSNTVGSPPHADAEESATKRLVSPRSAALSGRPCLHERHGASRRCPGHQRISRLDRRLAPYHPNTPIPPPPLPGAGATPAASKSSHHAHPGSSPAAAPPATSSQTPSPAASASAADGPGASATGP